VSASGLGRRTAGEQFSGTDPETAPGARQFPSASGEEQERNVGIRETLNKNPTYTAAGTAAIILLALLFIMWQACDGGGGGPGAPGQAFYSIDDGKTYFIDEAGKIPPFKKDGKDAVRAHVFTCDGGKTKFVGYLEAYSPQDKKVMEETISGKRPAQPYPGYTGQAMVKKPGMPNFIPLMPGTTEAYAKVVQVTCPDANTVPERVYPDE
jgi:hypothetical protein